MEVLTHQINTWVEDFTDELYSWAYHKTSSKENAEDLVQETFLSAFKAFDSFKNESSPKSWLFKILNNKIIDYYRKSAKNPIQLAKNEEQASLYFNGLFNENSRWKNYNIEDIWDQEQNLLDNEEFIILYNNCINSLPEKWKQVIHAKYIIDAKANEICKELEITTSNYWQIIHRAKVLLKNCLEQKWI